MENSFSNTGHWAPYLATLSKYRTRYWNTRVASSHPWATKIPRCYPVVINYWKRLFQRKLVLKKCYQQYRILLALFSIRLLLITFLVLLGSISISQCSICLLYEDKKQLLIPNYYYLLESKLSIVIGYLRFTEYRIFLRHITSLSACLWKYFLTKQLYSNRTFIQYNSPVI